MVSEKEKLKNKILTLIDESTNNWAKMAFYSDPKVATILERVYGEWEQNNRRGLPIDYATLEELQVLAKAAEKYKNAGPEVIGILFRSEAKSIHNGGQSNSVKVGKRFTNIKNVLRQLLGL